MAHRRLATWNYHPDEVKVGGIRPFPCAECGWIADPQPPLTFPEDKLIVAYDPETEGLGVRHATVHGQPWRTAV